MEALQAQASRAQVDFTRIEGLVERGILPRVKLDEQRTALNVAENGLRAKTAERAVINEQLNQWSGAGTGRGTCAEEADHGWFRRIAR